MSTTLDRKTAREHLASLLRAALTGEGGLAEAVHEYQVADFGGVFPVVTVSSGGARRKAVTLRGSRQPRYRLQVHVFVLYADEGSGWTEKDAEDRLDDIERKIANVIDANPKAAGIWEAIEQEAMSETDSVVIGGLEYRREVLSYLIGLEV